MDLETKLKSMMTGIELQKTKEIQTDNCFDSECCVCSGTGWEEYIEDGIKYVRECKCGTRKKKMYQNRMEFANIPESFKDVRLDNFRKNVYQNSKSREEIVSIAKAVRYWINNLESMKKNGIGLYMYSGTKGSGKTRLAISIANELIEKYDMQVKFATSIQILDEIKSTWGNRECKESSLINDISDAEVLIIDDFGVEGDRQWIEEKFYNIINSRYVNKKITIFTSNLRLDDIQHDERITNRITERVLQIPFPEESIRKHIGMELMNQMKNGMEE